ncbi:tetratricopeptide repeat protein [Dyella monticola]|nr:hypothetical protein [Dyella monticola]
MSKTLVYFLSGIVLLVVAVVYWPIVHANFVWDDWQSFRDYPWLTQGDQWKHAIFRGFNFWTYYFRPLVVAFFALQVHQFGSTPGPMHVVSLAIHVVNTALVGTLAWQLTTDTPLPFKGRTWVVPLCMALYGLHPALIEPVAWIGCQFDLILTMLMLIGLISNISIRQQVIRAVSLTIFFFLAACAKESAISFPLLVLVCDWILIKQAGKQPTASALRVLIYRNGLAYAGMFLSGCAYVIFRHWALGSIAGGLKFDSISLFSRLQEACFVYLHYWKIILWPTADLSPIHPVSIAIFDTWSLVSFAMAGAALGIPAFGVYAGIKHASPLGLIILAVTVALLPVVHIIPGHFELSLYHERYATMAIAVMCAMLPLLYRPLRLPSYHAKSAVLLGSMTAASLWLALSIVTIRLTLPLWSNDVTLWRWALAKNPEASQAKSSLLLAYIKYRDFDAATKLADAELSDPTPCFSCMVGIAQFATANDDISRATLALQRMRSSAFLAKEKGQLQVYYLLSGRLLMQENKLDAAERTVRMGIAVDPANQKAKELLEEILARKGQPGSPQ